MKMISAIEVKRIILIAFALSLCYACNRIKPSESEDTHVIVPVKATFSIHDPNTIVPPTVVKAKKPDVTIVGKLEEYRCPNNQSLALSPETLNIKTPAVRKMGEDGVQKPVVIKIDPTKKKESYGLPQRIPAQNAHSVLRNPYSFSSIGKMQGLRHDQIRAMLQDSIGNLWLGTDNGLTRFDGKYFYHYTKSSGLHSNLIISVLLDSKGNIWAGTFRGGVSRFDGHDITTFTIDDGLANDIVNSICEDSKGNIWFGTGNGLSCFDGNSFTNYTTQQGLSNNEINSITQDRDGKLWIGTNAGGLSILDGDTFINYSEACGCISNSILSVSSDLKGDMWIGTKGQGVIKYDGKTFVRYSEKQGLPSNSICHVKEDTKGHLWMGTTDKGLGMFDGQYFWKFHSNEGLNSNWVRCILEDKDGTIWIGTRNSGLVKFRGDIFLHITEDEGLTQSWIMSIMEEKPGVMWLGTHDGYAMRYEKRKTNNINQRYITKFGASEGLKSNHVYCIFKDNKGRIWFGTDEGGVSVFDGHKTESYTKEHGLCSNDVMSIFQDKQGYLWFATYGGVSKFDGENFTNYTIKNGLSGNNVVKIIQDRKGNLWFASDGGGVCVYDGQNFKSLSRKNNFFSDVVLSLLEDSNGNIWMGTFDEGLIKYDGNTFTQYSEKENVDNRISSLALDHHGNLWAGSWTGLFRFDKELTDAPAGTYAPYLIKRYDYDEGFIGVNCNLGALTVLSNEQIWIGTVNRLTIYYSKYEQKESPQPNLQITGLSIFNEDIQWNNLTDSTILHNGLKTKEMKFNGTTKWYGLPMSLELPYNYNILKFSYINTIQTRAKDVKYRYMLEGMEKNWNVPDEKTEASYNNLAPGKYTFRVKATMGNGVWGKEANFSFTVLPPWWKTWWFYLSMFSIGVATILIVIQNREKKLKINNEVLEKKVAEQTQELSLKNIELESMNQSKDKLFTIIAHDLKGPFSSFLGLSQVLSENIDSLSESDISKFAHSINTSAQGIFQLLENLLHWARMQQGRVNFSPCLLNLRNIIINHLDWALKTATDKNINVIIDIPEDIHVVADEKILQTVVRNILNNAIKFTNKGGEVCLQAKVNDSSLEISITDQGIGMPPEILASLFDLNKVGRKGTNGEPSTGLGLIICKELIEKHNGIIQVDSVEGKGTTFTIKLPLEYEVPEQI